MTASATLRYMKGSAQKVRLVADLVRGKKVNDAVAILRHTRKVAAKDLLKLLRSAVANAEQKEAHVDIDTLRVRKITVDKGPQEKRVRPAPMEKLEPLPKTCTDAPSPTDIVPLPLVMASDLVMIPPASAWLSTPPSSITML